MFLGLVTNCRTLLLSRCIIDKITYGRKKDGYANTTFILLISVSLLTSYSLPGNVNAETINEIRSRGHLKCGVLSTYSGLLTGGIMTRIKKFRVMSTVVILLALVKPASADPDLLELFRKDPFRIADIDGCSVCHVNPNGAGELNDFGSAFEAAGQAITPLMRVEFSDRFEVVPTPMLDGSKFYFPDPNSEVAVFERNERLFVIDLMNLGTEKLPRAKNSLSFFITSVGLGRGGHLRGLAGADQHCHSLADSVGAGDRTWHAYLSTSFRGKPVVNAGDRIGPGPWFNARGYLVARGPADLHAKEHLSNEIALNEKGEVVVNLDESGKQYGILTGSLPGGTAAIDTNCNNWTSDNKGTAMLGAMLGHPNGKGEPGHSSWTSAHESSGCSQKDLRDTGSDGLFYCFAID